MLIADFTNTETDTIMISGLFQWDYGQQLEIRGLNLPEMVQIHFSVSRDCGNALRMVGSTVDGVTTVKIPDTLLAEQEFCNDTYTIWAFVYISDETSGETVKRIAIKTKSRPKPEDYTEPEHENPFEDTLEQVKQYADQAEQSATDAETAQAGAEKAYQDTIEAVEQIKEDHMAMAEKIAIKPTASGTDIVVEDSADWRLLDFTAQGWTEQVQTEGNQLFDASKLPTKSQGGATVTNNGDGSFTISGSGNLTEGFLHSYTIDNTFLKKGYINSNIDNKVVPLFYVYGVDSDSGVTFTTSASGKAEITSEIAQKTKQIIFVFFDSEGEIITPITIWPMVYQDGDGTWEPFSGRYHSPRPEIRTKQLFDASKLPTKSQGGATVTNNGDGSFTISGEGNLTESLSLTYSYTHEETVKLIKSGMIYLTGANVYPRVGIALFVNNKAVVSLNSGQSANVLNEYIEDESSYLYLSFYGESGQAIIPGTIRPMLYQDGDGEWEPYGTVEAWPQPIVSAAEDAKTEEGKYPVMFSLAGKNLINFDEYYNSFSGADGYEGNANEINQIKINLPKSLIGKQVCFSAKIKISGDLTGSYVATIIGGVRKIGNSITNKNDFEISKVVFKPETEEDSIYITYGSNKENTVFFKDLMLSLGEEVGFEPYKNPQTVTITSGCPLTKWDRLEKRDGKWGWNYGGKITELVGDTSEPWELWPTVIEPDWLGMKYKTVDGTSSRNLLYCNFFPCKNTNGLLDDINVYIVNGNIHFTIPRIVAEDKDSWLFWLSKKKEEGKPLYIVYQLDNPEWVELSSEEQSALNALETYYPTTVIINSANMEMQLKYVADPQHYLEQHYESKLETIDAVIERVAALEEQKIKEV